MLDGRGVVDTITGDGDNVSESLASFDDQELLGRSGSGEDNFILSDPAHDGTALLDLIIVESLFGSVNSSELVTVDDNSLALLEGFLFSDGLAVLTKLVLEDGVELLGGVSDNVDFVGNSSGSGWLITSDHDNLNTGGTALLDGDIDLGARRVIEGHETDKGESTHGEPTGRLVGGVLSPASTIPLGPLLGVESVVAGVGSAVELDTGEGENTLTHETEARVGSLSFEGSDSIVLLFNEVTGVISEENLADSLEDLLGGTLEVDSGLIIAHIADDEVELDTRVERNGQFSLISTSADRVLGSDGFEGVLVLFNSSSVNETTIRLHEGGSDETNDTGLRSITLGASLQESSCFLVGNHLFFSLSKGCLGGWGSLLTLLRQSYSVSLVGLDVGLLNLVLLWIVLEESGGREGKALDEGLEERVLLVIVWGLSFADLLTPCLLSGKRLFLLDEGLDVDFGVDDGLVEEKMGHSHSVLSEGTGLV